VIAGEPELANTPEGACLLDAMIDYARNDAFVAESSGIEVDMTMRRP
jgi:hypothetical protein